MREDISQQSQSNFKVAPLISDDKLTELKSKILSTLLGISTLSHYQYNDADQDTIVKIKVLSLIMYFVVPLLIVIPSSVIVNQKLHALAVLIPAIICPILSLIMDLYLNKQKYIHKYVVTAVYSYLWSVHFYISRQLLEASLIQSSTYTAILILSLITLLTSSSTISFAPVRQFSGSTFDYSQFNIHSTLYIRFYVLLPILITQMGLYYSVEAGLWFESIVGVQFGVSVGFGLWVLGWVSSLYNTIMFFVNNILNGLVFGEQLSHSGNNYRSHTWWVSFIILSFNIAAIGFNILLIELFRRQQQPLDKTVQCQHILLICLAYYTSLVTTFVVYLSYRCSGHRNILMRFNKYNLKQAKDNNKISYFLGHKQIVMFAINLLLPAALCLLIVYVFGQFYNAYNGGINYQRQTNFNAQKLTTYIILLIDVICYVSFVLFKQITRVRSKLGCLINPGCFKNYYVQIQRDLFEKITLKVTGGLAIMALVLRIQHIDVFANFILSLAPLSPLPHPYINFFVSEILCPILIYRSYKRSQTFSHFFHVTIIVSFVLILIDSTLYFYPSIFVVLAFPNFPQNAFRLLFLSPFLTPKKLLHKSQCLYRVGYLLVNLFTLFLYVITLGTLEFTSIMGLPMYWCVIPSINCQSTNSKYQIEQVKSQKINLKKTFSDLQISEQALKEIPQVSRSTPEHNLYQKIVSEIPFYIFRNKKPGYYLLRISKYILLVEVVMDFYGLFQTVNLIGLQTQQVTTCHAKQGETIDRIIDYTWGDNPLNIQKCQCQDLLKTVIHEQHCISDTQFTSQNQIQLTGIIQSAQFYQLFKKCLIKSIIFNYNKMLKKNLKYQLNSQQNKEAQILLDDLQGRISKDRIDQFFPFNFVNEEKHEFIFKVRYFQSSPSKILIKKKLPPIKKNDKNDKPKKSDLLADFADLIQQNNTSNSIKPNIGDQSKGQKFDIDRQDQQNLTKLPIQDKREASDLHMAVITSAYLAILGKINYLNTQRLYKMLKKDASVLSQFQFQGGLDLVANSVGCAFKIAIGKQLEGEQNATYSDFVQYDKNQFFGTLESPGFSQAISTYKNDIWTVAYHQTKKMLTIKRLAKNKAPLYMFSFENHAVQAVWNNLRFQLLFATNDNDERYSIQTHPYLLRNLLVQGCEQPYGYAGYYSQQFLNL